MTTELKHHPRRHAAVRTESYLYSQLIPYIGNKRKLLPLVADALEATGVRKGTFVDLFTGSTVVARCAKSLGFRVLANDWEPYSYEIARATVALNTPPPFASLGGPEAVFAELNSATPVDGYVSRHLCPRDDANPDVQNERMFFTRANGNRIDAMREKLRQWDETSLVDEAERAYVLAAMVYAVSYVSNTSGVFKGFHKGWGGQTQTALYRILSEIELKQPVLHDNERANLATRLDAQSLTGDLAELLRATPDIVYIDPPYNQHPYGSNYHVLNTVVLWDSPPLNETILVDGKPVDKSAIRKDWRTERRSPYNSAREAPGAFRRLIDGIDARWLLVSYSTDGNIAIDEVLETLSDRGSLRLFANAYKRYRVSTQRMSPKSHNVEFVAVVDTTAKGRSSDAAELTELIYHREADALAIHPRLFDVA